MLNYSVTYVGRVDDSTAGYPFGRPKNLTALGNGTPGQAGWVNDWWGACYAIIYDAGEVLNNIPESTSLSQVAAAIRTVSLVQANAVVTSAEYMQEAPLEGAPYVADGGDWVVEPGGTTVTLDGPVELTAGVANVYTVTDYNSFSTYVASASAPNSASISGDQITLTVDAGQVDPVTLTVARDGVPFNFSIPVGL